jgi:hypothetical protein
MEKDQLLSLIQSRKSEIDAYQINIDNYETIISMLPQHCPDNLKQYVTSNPPDLIDILPAEDIQLISDIQFKERLRKTLLTEKLEQRKSTFVLAALEKKLESF